MATDDLSPRPAPSLAALRQRLHRRSARPASALASDLGAFPEGQLRDAWTGLELEVSHGRVRAWDPSARSLLVLAEEGHRIRVLHAADAATDGVGAVVPFSPQEAARVVALAARDPLDPELWRLWLADARRSDLPLRELARDADERLHLREAVARPAPRAADLRVDPDLDMTTHPDLADALREAAAAGRAGDAQSAARAYGAARAQASALEHRPTWAKASAGLALALGELGYSADAEALLLELVVGAALSPPWAAVVAGHLCEHALLRRDAEAAASWLEARRALPGDAAQTATLALQVAELRGDDDRVVALADGVLAAVEPGDSAWRGLAAGWSRAAAQARRSGIRADPQSLPDAPDAPLEIRVLQATCRADLTSADEAWAWLKRRLPVGRRGLSALEGQWLMGLVERLVDAGSASAADALRLRLAGLGDAGAVPLAGVAEGAAGLWALSLDGGVRRLSGDRPTLRLAVEAARAEVLAGVPAARCALLAGQLSLPQDLHADWILASDGCLDGLPVPALVGRSRLPRELALLARPPAWTPPSGARWSLADAAGDLPGAARELSALDLHQHLLGPDARLDALASAAGPLALVHLAVHSRRDAPPPVLLFADGAAGPAELSALGLTGRPLVLLSGCATAARGTTLGAERALSAALLAAGAGAVVSTRWPVEDAEMARLMNRLGRQPGLLTDPVAAASRACAEARAGGAAPRIWAALVVQ